MGEYEIAQALHKERIGIGPKHNEIASRLPGVLTETGRYEEALEIFREFGDVFGEIFSLRHLSGAAWGRADLGMAITRMEEAMALARQNRVSMAPCTRTWPDIWPSRATMSRPSPHNGSLGAILGSRGPISHRWCQYHLGLTLSVLTIYRQRSKRLNQALEIRRRLGVKGGIATVQGLFGAGRVEEETLKQPAGSLRKPIS
jgi:tetratricopeptide (TPR) repeat protein